MSEQKAEQTSAESGSLDAAPAASQSSDSQSAPVSAQQPMQETASIEAPGLVPEQGGTGEAAGRMRPSPKHAQS